MFNQQFRHNEMSVNAKQPLQKVLLVFMRLRSCLFVIEFQDLWCFHQ